MFPTPAIADPWLSALTHLPAPKNKTSSWTRRQREANIRQQLCPHNPDCFYGYTHSSFQSGDGLFLWLPPASLSPVLRNAFLASFFKEGKGEVVEDLCRELSHGKVGQKPVFPLWEMPEGSWLNMDTIYSYLMWLKSNWSLVVRQIFLLLPLVTD